jgi:hypothetical protein
MLSSHLHQLGIKDSPYRNNNQTPQHVLQECPALTQSRLENWPHETPVGKKLGDHGRLRMGGDFPKPFGIESIPEESRKRQSERENKKQFLHKNYIKNKGSKFNY